MNVKKLVFPFIITFVFGCGISLAPGVSHAAVSPMTSGQWDQVDYDDYTVVTSSEYRRPYNEDQGIDYTVPSHGGDFGIKIHGYDSSTSYDVELWEYDPGNADDHIKDINNVSSDQIAKFSNIGSALDGSNNTAEFYVKIKTNYGTNAISIQYLD